MKNYIFFPNTSSEESGIITHLVKKSNRSPSFKINEVVRKNDKDYYFAPKKTYTNTSELTAFVILNGNVPFLKIDFHSISFLNGWTPLIEWIISASNTGNDNDLIQISAPEKNVSICERLGSTPKCKNDVSLMFDTNITMSSEVKYRYVKLEALQDRGREDDTTIALATSLSTLQKR